MAKLASDSNISAILKEFQVKSFYFINIFDDFVLVLCQRFR